jgi:hypothetical protein
MSSQNMNLSIEMQRLQIEHEGLLEQEKVNLAEHFESQIESIQKQHKVEKELTEQQILAKERQYVSDLG